MIIGSLNVKIRRLVKLKKMGEVDLPKTVNAALNLAPEDEHCFSDEIWTYQKEIESPFENNLIHLNGLISVCEIYIDGELFFKNR